MQDSCELWLSRAAVLQKHITQTSFPLIHLWVLAPSFSSQPKIGRNRQMNLGMETKPRFSWTLSIKGYYVNIGGSS